MIAAANLAITASVHGCVGTHSSVTAHATPDFDATGFRPLQTLYKPLTQQVSQLQPNAVYLSDLGPAAVTLDGDLYTTDKG